MPADWSLGLRLSRHFRRKHGPTLDDATRQALRDLPSVHELIASVRSTNDGIGVSESYLAHLARSVIDAARSEILVGRVELTDNVAAAFLEQFLLLKADGPTRVLNGTGVIIHTNLGRSPVSAATAQAMAVAARNYLPLEVHLDTGLRGGRGHEIDVLLRALTGAQRSIAVNNNAAAILLALTALCDGNKVIVSRGEAVEIGGGFRIPDVMRQSGAVLVEVGTTNRTRIADYEEAIDSETVALLSVHASNFEISGFTEKPALAELSRLAHDHGLLLIEDVGSGCLVDTTQYGLKHEPTLSESIEAGVDVVTASGDKLLGGPQAGLILGTGESVSKIARHPLARAVRIDKTVQAGVAETLRHYLTNEYEDRVPIWWMISRTVEQLDRRVQSWLDALDDSRCRCTSTVSVVGGGSLPGKSQASRGLTLQVDGLGASEITRRLRIGEPPVFARVADEVVIIDARTILPDQDDDLINAIRVQLDGSGGL